MSGYQLLAAPGTFSVSGAPASIGVVIEANEGSFLTTGQAVTLTAPPPPIVVVTLPPLTKLPIPTADNTYITADTTFWTADGACLINGGGLPLSLSGGNSPTRSGSPRF